MLRADTALINWPTPSLSPSSELSASGALARRHMVLGNQPSGARRDAR